MSPKPWNNWACAADETETAPFRPHLAYAATLMDGYPMMQAGEPGRPLALALLALAALFVGGAFWRKR